MRLLRAVTGLVAACLLLALAVAAVPGTHHAAADGRLVAQPALDVPFVPAAGAPGHAGTPRLMRREDMWLASNLTETDREHWSIEPNWIKLVNTGGMWVWITIASKFRQSLHWGSDPVLDFDHLEVKPLLTYVAPLIATLGLMLISLLATLLPCLFLSTCCRRRLVRRSHRPYGRKHWIIVVASMSFVAFAVIVGIITNIEGLVTATRSVNIMGRGLETLFYDVYATTDSLPPSLATAFQAIGRVANQTTDDVVTTIDPPRIVTEITTAGDALTTAILATRDDVLTIQSATNRAQADVDRLQSDLTTAKATLNTVNAYIATGYGASSASSAGGGVTVSRQVAFPAVQLPTSPIDQALSAVNDVTQIAPVADQIATALGDLNNALTTVNDNMATVESTIQSSVDTSTGTVKRNVDTTLRTTQSDILTSINLGEINSQIEDVQNTLSPYLADLHKYDRIEFIVHVVVVGLIFLVLIAVITGLVLRKPKVQRVSALTGVACSSFSLLLAIIFLLVFWAIGFACRSAIMPDGTISVDFVGNLIGDPALVERINSARRGCATGGGLVSVATAFNLVDANTVNFTSQAEIAVDAVDLTGLATNFDLNAASLPTMPTADLNGISSQTAAATGAATSLQDALANVNTVLSNEATMRSAIEGYCSDRTELAFTWTGTATTPEKAADMDAWGAACEAAFAVYGDSTAPAAANNFLGTMVRVRTDIQDAEAQVDVITGFDVAGMVNGITTAYNGFRDALTATTTTTQTRITLAVPSIKSSILGAIPAISDRFNADTTCENIAEDSYVLQYGLCKGTLYGGDSIWFSFFVMGIVLAANLGLSLFAANVVADGQGADYTYSDAKKVTPAGGKAGQASGKKTKGQVGVHPGDGDETATITKTAVLSATDSTFPPAPAPLTDDGMGGYGASGYAGSVRSGRRIVPADANLAVDGMHHGGVAAAAAAHPANPPQDEEDGVPGWWNAMRQANNDYESHIAAGTHLNGGELSPAAMSPASRSMHPEPYLHIGHEASMSGAGDQHSPVVTRQRISAYMNSTPFDADHAAMRPGSSSVAVPYM
ncbi:hypothetical protein CAUPRSCDRAFT_11272, partial [Caulochytrium protostelioides]